VIAECGGFKKVGHTLVPLNVKASLASPSNWYMSVMSYTFTPTAGGAAQTFTGSSGVVAGSNDKVARFHVTPGKYSVAATSGGPQATYTLTATNCILRPVDTKVVPMTKRTP